jgi:hypothetical protein
MVLVYKTSRPLAHSRQDSIALGPGEWFSSTVEFNRLLYQHDVICMPSLSVRCHMYAFFISTMSYVRLYQHDVICMPSLSVHMSYVCLLYQHNVICTPSLSAQCHVSAFFISTMSYVRLRVSRRQLTAGPRRRRRRSPAAGRRPSPPRRRGRARHQALTFT